MSEAVAAERAGAGRIELCGALPVGGVTPSPGLYDEVTASVSIPIAVFVRTTEGGFDTPDPEFRALLRDIKWFTRNGAAHIVAGTVDASGEPDDRNRAIIDAAQGRAAFHRAFDTVPDMGRALESLVSLGFSRVLTSGGPGRAIDNAESIRGLVTQAGDRLTILVGGKVRADHVVSLVRVTGCSEVHLASRLTGDGEYSGFSTPFPSDEATEVVAALREAGI